VQMAGAEPDGRPSAGFCIPDSEDGEVEELLGVTDGQNSGRSGLTDMASSGEQMRERARQQERRRSAGGESMRMADVDANEARYLLLVLLRRLISPLRSPQFSRLSEIFSQSPNAA
jgi:hypothetical protein